MSQARHFLVFVGEEIIDVVSLSEPEALKKCKLIDEEAANTRPKPRHCGACLFSRLVVTWMLTAVA